MLFRSAPAGSAVTQIGEPGASFFVIIDGTVAVRTPVGAGGQLHPGEFFAAARKASKITALPLLLLPNGQRIGQRNGNGRLNGTGGQRNGLGIPWHPHRRAAEQGLVEGLGACPARRLGDRARRRTRGRDHPTKPPKPPPRVGYQPTSGLRRPWPPSPPWPARARQYRAPRGTQGGARTKR